MGTRGRQENKGKAHKGTRGEGRNKFFGNSIKDFERINKRCESLIIMRFFPYFFFSLNLWLSW